MIIKHRKKYKDLLHSKKSSEIRLGKIGENMAPFLKDWPWDPNNFHFIGYPTDGIQFNDDEVIFVEIKTGKSRLTPSQRKIRDVVKEGKVSFAVFRIGENGVDLKKGELENGDV
jgi:predicted Holliday junction resolvase-like endonuclease